MNAEDTVRDQLLADGWNLFPDAGFIETAGPFFHRLQDGQPGLCFPVLDKHENRNGMLQGGALMTFVDRALGFTARHQTQTLATTTVTLTLQFVDGVKLGETVHVMPTMTRATKQLVFMSGVFMVGERTVCVANGIWKKIVAQPKW
ncbi:PaaI family thioesterase [Hydrogenophaga sp. BPS33]|uniref:PaaI family thioesterase n=1 Tax=Hydrogenophaga sp. BPS33 TaxID=2651974 RepID=UPI00131FDCA0|nr:hotdog domain-containing protein [Hydrogenophaga sp. BPS33]QHE83966.1 PaaI family thioesterase [Hydrogenophaga sp. BPS33]